MRVLSLQELLRHPAGYLEELSRLSEATTIVKDGKPWLRITPVTQEPTGRGAALPNAGVHPTLIKITPDGLTPESDAIPPDYLAPYARPTLGGTAAKLLHEGRWCGHGGQAYGVFELQLGACDEFELKLPTHTKGDDLRPPVVLARPVDGSSGWFAVYDPRRHPLSLFAMEEFKAESPLMETPFVSPDGQGVFRVAVGFEYGPDHESPEETTWFALAVECPKTGWKKIVFEDETS